MPRLNKKGGLLFVTAALPTKNGARYEFIELVFDTGASLTISFRCLDFEMSDFMIACHNMNSRLGVAGILGMNFIQHFRIDLNFLTGEIFSIKKVSSMT